MLPPGTPGPDISTTFRLSATRSRVDKRALHHTILQCLIPTFSFFSFLFLLFPYLFYTFHYLPTGTTTWLLYGDATSAFSRFTRIRFLLLVTLVIWMTSRPIVWLLLSTGCLHVTIYLASDNSLTCPGKVIILGISNLVLSSSSLLFLCFAPYFCTMYLCTLPSQHSQIPWGVLGRQGNIPYWSGFCWNWPTAGTIDISILDMHSVIFCTALANVSRMYYLYFCWYSNVDISIKNYWK